jgi:hypothetical protein
MDSNGSISPRLDFWISGKAGRIYRIYKDSEDHFERPTGTLRIHVGEETDKINLSFVCGKSDALRLRNWLKLGKVKRTTNPWRLLRLRVPDEVFADHTRFESDQTAQVTL